MLSSGAFNPKVLHEHESYQFVVSAVKDRETFYNST